MKEQRLLLLLMISLLGVSCSGPKVQWQPYDQKLIDQAKANGQPVIIDFFAEWCAPCHQLEAITYSDPRVIKALEEYVKLKIDATDPEDAYILGLLEKYEVPGLPMIIFYDREGQELAEKRIPGFVDADEFLQLLSEL